VWLGKVPLPIRMLGDCISIPGIDRIVRTIVFQVSVMPNPSGVTATESGRPPMVSMRYLLDHRCMLGMVYPVIQDHLIDSTTAIGFTLYQNRSRNVGKSRKYNRGWWGLEDVVMIAI